MKQLPICVLTILLSCDTARTQIITTVAGTGTMGYNGDNIPATSASLYGPASVTTDNTGNIIIADFLNNRIRKINSSGVVSTIAGNGSVGYSGDGMPAVNASLYSPQSPSVDQNGNIYFTDGNNNRIRKINSLGTISTIAGTGSAGYNGDNRPATSALLNYPSNGVVVDNLGNVYISDSFNHRVRKINSNGTITTIAGNGTAGYNGDSIPATSASLNYPCGLFIDASGKYLYIADGDNNRIRRIDTSGIITTIAGSGIAGFTDNINAKVARLNRPTSIVVDSEGNLYIADTYNHRIRKVGSNGVITTIAGTGSITYNGDNIPSTSANINYPNGIAIDGSGNLLIAELGNNRIRKVTGLEIILPLSLKKFTVDLRSNQGLLQWVTDHEKNVRHFVVEYSSDGVPFSAVGTVDSKNTAGLNSYSFVHGGLQPGTHYYRLKMVDQDGTFTYSQITSLKVKSSSALLLSTYPNPAADYLNLSFVSSTNNQFVISVTDISGKLVKTINGRSSQGLNKQAIDLHTFPRGAYLITVVNGEKEVETGKFFKQ